MVLDLLMEEGCEELHEDVGIDGGNGDASRVVYPDIGSSCLLDPAGRCSGSEAQGAGVGREDLIRGRAAVEAGAGSGWETAHLSLEAALLEAAICPSVCGHSEADISEVGFGVDNSIHFHEQSLGCHQGGQLLEDL